MDQLDILVMLSQSLVYLDFAFDSPRLTEHGKNRLLKYRERRKNP